MLRGLLLFASDIHWGLGLPDVVGRCFDRMDGDASVLRSLSTTASPNDTVFRRLDAVPGVTRIPLAGDPAAFMASTSGFLVVVFALFDVVSGSRLRWLLVAWRFNRDASVVSSPCAGVPQMALLNARRANTGAGVSGASITLESSAEYVSGEVERVRLHTSRTRELIVLAGDPVQHRESVTGNSASTTMKLLGVL